MIEIQSLTEPMALLRIQDVSFRVPKGDVVGFLGPNGAGETTTMRILCGCIGATSGEARVNGLSVIKNPKQVKRGIGYLPETPPLYPNMIVEEYISFMPSIKRFRPKVATSSSTFLGWTTMSLTASSTISRIQQRRSRTSPRAIGVRSR